MNTLLLNSALSSLLPWRITSSVRLLKENVTLSWAAWRIKNGRLPEADRQTESMWSGERLTCTVLLRWLVIFNHEQSEQSPAIVTCHTSRPISWDFIRSQDSRLILAISCCFSLTTQHGTLEKTCANPQSKIGRIPLLLLVLTQYQYRNACIATCIAKFIAIHVFHVFWKDTPKCNKCKSANTTVLIHMKEDRIVTINVHLYSLIILSYSNIVQHGYKIQIPQNVTTWLCLASTYFAVFPTMRFNRPFTPTPVVFKGSSAKEVSIVTFCGRAAGKDGWILPSTLKPKPLLKLHVFGRFMPFLKVSTSIISTKHGSKYVSTCVNLYIITIKFIFPSFNQPTETPGILFTKTISQEIMVQWTKLASKLVRLSKAPFPKGNPQICWDPKPRPF